MSQNSDLAVVRSGEIFELRAGESLRAGDRIVNKGTEAATVSTVSKLPEHPSFVATLKPGEAVRVKDLGKPEDATLGLEAEEGSALVEQVNAELASAADFVVQPDVEVIEDSQGLFGAVPFLGGAGGLAAGAGAIGLAALAVGSDDDDSSSAGAGAGGPGGPGNGNDGGAGNGISEDAGGLAGGIAQLNDGLANTPLEPLTAITAPLADGLATAGEALANSGEPTGLGATLGELLGVPNAVSNAVTEGSGAAGLVETLSGSLSDAISAGPLAPLSAIVDPLSESVLSQLASGLDTIGAGIADIAPQDPTGLTGLLSNVLGNVPVLGGDTGTSPIDGLTGLLGGDLGGGLLGGGLLGGLPLSTSELTGALPTGGTGDLLAATDGLSGISSTAGLPGLDTLTGLLPF